MKLKFHRLNRKNLNLSKLDIPEIIYNCPVFTFLLPTVQNLQDTSLTVYEPKISGALSTLESSQPLYNTMKKQHKSPSRVNKHYLLINTVRQPSATVPDFHEYKAWVTNFLVSLSRHAKSQPRSHWQ